MLCLAKTSNILEKLRSQHVWAGTFYVDNEKCYIISLYLIISVNIWAGSSRGPGLMHRMFSLLYTL